MKIHCAHNALVDPATLKPNPVNPNRHSAHQIQLLASIIQEQGWRGPITVSKRSGLIVRGHGRLEAALLMGAEKVPVDYQDYASEAEELADLLADNRLSELAELDEDDLKRVIESIRESDPSFDVELTGFMDDEIARLYDEKPEDDVETVPRMEIQAFEHHDYLVFYVSRPSRLDARAPAPRRPRSGFLNHPQNQENRPRPCAPWKTHPRPRPPRRCRRWKSTCSPRRTGRNWLR